MPDFYSLASTRRSIRKFTEDPVPLEDILDCIKTAVTAPSGCNSQCWEFRIVRNRDVLHKIADAVIQKNLEILESIGIADDTEYLEGKNKLSTFFTKAPVCIAVFMTGLDYYDKKMAEAWSGKGYSLAQLIQLIGQPNLLSVGAAVQTLLLALHEKGYGACWMNDPVIAGPEINKILDIPAEHPLISLIPVGFPAYTPRFKAMKPMEEIVKIID